MNLKEFILVVVIFGLIVNNNFLFAQDTAKFKVTPIGIILLPTFSNINMSNLNSRLKQVGYPSFSNNCFQFAGGVMLGNIKSERLFTSFESSFIRQVNSNDDVQESLTITEFIVNIHYNIFLKKNYLLHPFVGFGYSLADFKLSNKLDNVLSFDSSLSKINGQREISSNNSFLINAGIGINKLLFIGGTEWLIGINTGYRFNVNELKWNYNNNNLSNSPNLKTGGFYAGIVLGFY